MYLKDKEGMANCLSRAWSIVWSGSTLFAKTFLYQKLLTIIVVHINFEPPHDKTNKMACAPSKDSDQPGHSPCLISLCSRHEKTWVLSHLFEHTAKTLIRLGGCPRWYESLLGTQSFCWFCHEVAHTINLFPQLPIFTKYDFCKNLYRKFPKYSDTQKICCNHSKIWTMWLYHSVMSPNDADRMANSVDPDQTAPLGAVWSGSAMFAQAYLSENLGSLR